MKQLQSGFYEQIKGRSMDIGHQRRVIIVMLLAMVTFELVTGQRLDEVCKDVPDDTDHARLKPRISNVFRVDVECKLSEQHSTAYVTEYYDYQRNRGRLTVKKPHGQLNDFFMDYDSNMVLLVDPHTSTCRTGMLMLSGDKFIFGYRLEDYTSQMFSPSGALHFSNVNESYNGTSMMRGIAVDEWHSCQYLDAISATARVVWYFSRKGAWTMQLGIEAVPVRMRVIGKQVLANQTKVDFDHTYDFFNFEQSVNPGDFEVPDGVFCPERDVLQVSKPFPQIPDSFYFAGEIVDPYSKDFSIMQEAYDNDTKYAGYSFSLDSSKLTDINRYTELNDYNTGVAYLIDNSVGSCTLSPIREGIMAFTKVVNNQQVRMETPREFFMDSKVHYQYAGSKTIRNILCERWVGITDQARGYLGVNVTVEFYFATEDLESWNDNTDSSTANYRIPVLFRMYLPGDLTSPSYEFHIFYFNVMDPYLSEIDTSQCFTGTERKTMSFFISKDQENVVRQNTLQTVLAIQTAVSKITQISILRVTDVHLLFNPLNLWVTFNVLERPPHYDDVITDIKESSLREALRSLQTAFMNQTFQIVINTPRGTVQVTPVYSSLKDISDLNTSVQQQHNTNSNGDVYSGGILAAVAISMLIVGGASGATGGFFYFK